eukprot:3372415-Pleurochrysis_carterae.AAC.2
MTWSFSWSGEARSRAQNGASNARQPSRSRAFQCRSGRRRRCLRLVVASQVARDWRWRLT